MLYYISNREMNDGVSPTGSQDTGGNKDTRDDSVAARSTASLDARDSLSAEHGADRTQSSLVDPASSHMLVSKIKPCMSQCMPN